MPTSTLIPAGILTHKYVMRQSLPAPVHFTAAANTQTNTLFGLPANHVVCGVMVQLMTTFSAFGLSAFTVTVGGKKDALVDADFYCPAISLLQTVGPTSFKYWSPLAMFTTEPHDITATFTATGAQIGTITAGEVLFTILYRPL